MECPDGKDRALHREDVLQEQLVHHLQQDGIKEMDTDFLREKKLKLNMRSWKDKIIKI